MNWTIFFVSTLFLINANAQTVGYDDVAVIVNDNSQTSIEIGNYFQSARNIPNQNMIHIAVPTTEDIDSATFAQLRAEVESHLISNNMVESTNYLVTTKGVPLTINGGCVTNMSNGYDCASVDAELALILGPYSNDIGADASILNPMYGAIGNLDKASSGIYLVTRLDGYTKEDVFQMIDNSGPNTGINQTTAKAIVDISNAVGNDSVYFTDLYMPAYDFLINNSWNGEFDVNTLPLTNQSNVFGYLGLGHGPLPSATFNYDWTQGGVGLMSMCNSGFTFDATANTTNAVLLADLIADGSTGAIGHVDYIFFAQILSAEIFINRYLDPTINYTFAEAAYISDSRLSWQTVVIGDPKASVVVDNLASLEDLELTTIQMFPNPSTGMVKVRSEGQMHSISIIDLNGKEVKRRDQLESYSVDLDLSQVVDGIYIIQAEVEGNLLQERLLIQH